MEAIMGTSSRIYVETEPGDFIGTYCHYDGYPSHMHGTLERMSSDELTGFILQAIPQGGFRSLDIGEVEYLGDSRIAIHTNPYDDNMGPNYIYIKLLDGCVRWRSSCESYWNEEARR